MIERFVISAKRNVDGSYSIFCNNHQCTLPEIPIIVDEEYRWKLPDYVVVVSIGGDGTLYKYCSPKCASRALGGKAFAKIHSSR